MWLLKDSNGILRYLKPNQTFTVGRKKGNLVLGDDSVSRNHAEITIVPKQNVSQIESNTEPLSTCQIRDPGSKYGSFILREENPELQVSGNGSILQPGDEIRFGVQQSIFTVMYVAIITATSGLDKDEKSELQGIIDLIDGKVTLGWLSACTHMTVAKSNISEKLTCALAYGTPIVPIGYWKCVLKAFEANEELPDPLEFTKMIDDKLTLLGNVTVRPNPRRRMIFKGLTFVHYDCNQYNLHYRMIELAGGKSLLYRNRKQQDIDVCADNVIVVQLVESNTTQATGTGNANYAEACQQLGKHRRRTIPAAEIALAIIQCSSDKLCNPKFDHAGMFKKNPVNPADKSSVVALDTQDVDPPVIASRVKPIASRTITGNRGLQIGESLPRSDYIRESTEQSSKIESLLDDEIILKKLDNCLPVSAANTSCLSQLANPPRSRGTRQRDYQSNFDESSSLRVASHNYGRNIDDECDMPMDITKRPIKRDHEEEDDAEARTTKKIRAGVSHDDEDVVFLDEKPSTQRDIFEIKPHGSCDPTSPLPVVRKVGDHGDSPGVQPDREAHVENISQSIRPRSSSSILTNPYASTESYHSCISQSGERSSSNNTDEDETTRKRKARRLEASPSWDVMKSPLKRNKTTPNSPKIKSKLPEKPELGQTTLTKFLSPKKNVTDQTDWTPAGKVQKKFARCSTDFNTPSVNSSGERASPGNRRSETTEYHEKSNDPNVAQPSLLRVETLSDTAGVKKFGKCFHKIYKITPRRIEMDDLVDMRSWNDEKNNSSRKRLLSDDETISPGMSSYLRNVSKVMKTLRV